MRAVYIAGMGLVLGLVASANAQDVQWRTANSGSSTEAAVTLQAPVALGAPQPLQPTNSPTGFVARAKMIDPPAPQSVGSGPQLDSPPRAMPSFSTPGAAPAPTETWGTDVSSWVGNGAAPAPATGTPIASSGPMPGPIDGCACDSGCGDSCCGGLPRWFGGRRWAQSNGCCDACGDGCCAPRPVFYASGEYLMWTVKNGNTPPLVTANPNAGALPVIGVAGTTVVAGGAQDYDIRSGGRFTVGFGLPCLGVDFGLETTYFFLGDRSHQAAFASTGTPSLGRPFVDVGPGLSGFPGNQNAELVALQGVVGGTVTVKTTSSLWGIEENIRQPICCGPNYKVDFLGGFRFMQLDESLQIVENLSAVNPGGGTSNFVVVDRFHTRDDFYGLSAGIDGEWKIRRWFIDGTFKLGMGDMYESVNIDGSTVGPNGTARGGLLTQVGSNIGHYTQNHFAILPEGEIKVGYNFTDHIRGFVGYDVLYVSNVVRPGDQVDINVNPTLLPGNGPRSGALLPAYQMHTTDFWAQGVTFGLEFRW